MSDSGPNSVSSSPPHERRVSRRDAIRAIAGGTTGVTTLAATSAPASARSVDEYVAEQDTNTTISEDTEWLERYRPALDLAAVPYDNRPTLYGWKATSPDRDTDVAVYATEYAVQKDFLTLTSHAGDHEWIYVFVDSASGEVVEVSYAAYHWLRGYLLNPPVDGSDGGDHPTFAVAKTYHNYIPTTASSGGVLLDVRGLGDPSSASGPFYQWLANGMADDLEPGAVHDPWQLDSEGPLDSWWARDGSGSLNRYIVDAWATLAFGVGIGIRGGDDADLGDAQP